MVILLAVDRVPPVKGRYFEYLSPDYTAHAAFGGYKKSGIGRENHKMMLDHYQKTKNMLVSYDINLLDFF